MSSPNRGFTLIELLVVIAIIGILSSVILASLNGARKKGRDARRVSDVKQIQLALEMWYDANGSEYPDAPSSLAPTYISVVPTDPQTAAAYAYDKPDECKRRVCGSVRRVLDLRPRRDARRQQQRRTQPGY